MKKILYITNLSRAINVFCVPHIEMLLSNNFTVDCACYIDKEPNKNLVNLGVKFYDVPFTRNPLNFKNIKALSELIKIQNKNKYDIVHVHTPTAAVYGRLLKLKFKDIKVIYTAHGFHFYKGAPLTNWLIYYPIEKILSRLTDTIITINKEDYIIAQKFNINRLEYIEGVGVDYSKIESIENRADLKSTLKLGNSFIILMVGDINKNKNQKQAIRAVKILIDKGFDIKLICAGEGPLTTQINEYIEELNLTDYVKLIGFRNDIESLMNICDIGISMSYREGLPKNIMEFMASQKAVIGTNIRGNKDIIEDGKNGYLVNLDDEVETADKIEILYKNPKILNELCKNALISSRRYNIENILSKLIKVYK